MSAAGPALPTGTIYLSPVEHSGDQKGCAVISCAPHWLQQASMGQVRTDPPASGEEGGRMKGAGRGRFLD